MRMLSNTNKPLSIGKMVAAFTEELCEPGSQIEIVDSRGNVVNLAEVKRAGKNTIKGARQPYTAMLQVVA